MSERAIAVVVLVGCAYGGVWSALECVSLAPLFVFLIVMSFWTVLVLWDQPQGDQRD